MGAFEVNTAVFCVTALDDGCSDPFILELQACSDLNFETKVVAFVLTILLYVDDIFLPRLERITKLICEV